MSVIQRIKTMHANKNHVLNKQVSSGKDFKMPNELLESDDGASQGPSAIAWPSLQNTKAL